MKHKIKGIIKFIFNEQEILLQNNFHCTRVKSRSVLRVVFLVFYKSITLKFYNFKEDLLWC